MILESFSRPEYPENCLGDPSDELPRTSHVAMADSPSEVALGGQASSLVEERAELENKNEPLDLENLPSPCCVAMADSPSNVAVGGQASSLVEERADLENKKEALALENARLANENMVLRNERLARENAALRMRSSMNAMQGVMMPPPMNARQQRWAGMNPWGMWPATCHSLGYGSDMPTITQHANDIISRANDLSFKARELRARALDLKDAQSAEEKASGEVSSMQRKEETRNGVGSKHAPSGDGEGSCPLALFGSSSASCDPGSMTSTSLPDSQATDALAIVPLHLRTTVMMRNIPNNYTREMLTELVNDEGFKGNYDLVYLPIDFQSKVTNLGYSFINFADAEVATRFQSHFSGFCKWTLESDKVCEVTWSDAIQGIDAHIERYRNSPVMHESVPDECKPVLFKEGERITFPEPTKKIRAPRQWQRQGCSSQHR